MTLSTISLDADTTTTAPAHICGFASWCTSHEHMDFGGILHLSDFSTGASGLVSGLKAYSWADGEPIGGASLVLRQVTPTSAPVEEWVRDWAAEQVRQDMRDQAHLS